MSFFKKYWKRIVVIGGLGVLFFWFRGGGDASVVYVTEPVAAQDIKREIALTGSVLSVQEVDTIATIAEVVEEIVVEIGQVVKKGDVLVVLDARQLEVQRQQALASVLSAQAQLDLLLEGVSTQDRVLSNQEIVRAESMYENTKKVQYQVQKINTQAYQQGLLDLELAEQAYDTAVLRNRNTLDGSDLDVDSAKKMLNDSYANAKTAFDNAWVLALETRVKANSILKQDPQYAEYNDYGFVEFGNRSKVLQSQVRAQYDLYARSVENFNNTIVAYEIFWNSDTDIETGLGEVLKLLDEAQRLTDGLFSTLDETRVTINLSVSTISSVRATLTRHSSELNASIAALRSVQQTIEDAKLGTRKTATSTLLTSDDSDAALLRAEINLKKAQENIESLAIDNDRKLLDIENEIDRAELTLESAQQGYAKTVAAPRSVETAGPRAGVQQAQARLAQVNLDLENATVRSPIDGIVTKIFVEIGQRVSLGVPLVRVNNPELEMIANVSETDIGDVLLEQEATVTFDAFSPQDRLQAIVQGIDPAETIVQGVIYYQVTFEIPETELVLRSGMTANIDLLIAEKSETLAVDSQSVSYEDGKAYVQIYTEEMEASEQRFVEIGMEGDRYFEVIDGLVADDSVVLYTE
jgi:RND family efflux transporter MFP subunit